MTTYFPFVPSNVIAPTFQPTLDGNIYTITVTWNLFGQRYYLNCYNQSANRVFTVAMTQTDPGLSIDTLSWDPIQQLVTVTTLNNHGYNIGDTLLLTIENSTPATYNGTFMMLVTDENTLTFPLSSDPGAMIIAGDLAYYVSMCKGYFNSTLIFRNGQFEVSP